MDVQDQRPKCENGCGFYGDTANRNLCSKCYTDFLKKIVLKTETKPCNNNTTTTEPTTITCSQDNDVANTSSVNAKIKTVNRCGACKKRVRLAGFKCQCGGTYCGLHRYPEEHACSFDHKMVGRQALSKMLYAAAECKASKLDYSI